MPFYQQRGRIPDKRHIAFRRENGGIFFEELIGNEGFQGASSLLYRLERPTQVLRTEPARELDWRAAPEHAVLQPRHLRLRRLPVRGNVVEDRIPVFMNGDVAVTYCAPAEPTDVFYRNGQGDEVFYVLEGEGRLETALGSLEFGGGDYLVIPRGIVYRLRWSEAPRLLIVESRGPVKVPRRYRNAYGQFIEGAPYSERDVRTPENLTTHDETGEFPVITKSRNALTQHVIRAHPFDVVGWDGAYYPWAFNIRDFEPIVGRIHQPPPVHQTFHGDGFVICSFVPRLFDFHPEAVPAPYHHSNAQSEELLFYASEEFMSRKGIEFGSMTYHPDGMPHGPHPGMAEKSIGAKETDEIAVMIDTFRPLTLAQAALEVDDPDYPTSWLEPGE